MLSVSVGTPKARAEVFRQEEFDGRIWRLLDRLLLMVALFGGVPWIRVFNGKS